MASIKNRENTFKVDFSNFPKRPTFEEIHKFVHDVLGLKIEQISRLQMNHAQNCAHVKCTDLQTASSTVQKHNGKHEMEVNNIKIKVRLTMDEGGVEIKIHDLSENVSNLEIAEFLKQYGDVLDIQEVVWGEKFAFKGVPTGIRVAKMVLKKHIKSFVNIHGEQTLITYKNQPQTCRHCTNLSHPGITCVQNKKILGQKADLDKRLKQAQTKSTNIVPTTNPVSNTANINSLMPRFAVNPTETLPVDQPIEIETAESQPAPTVDHPSPNVQPALTANDCERVDINCSPEVAPLDTSREINTGKTLIPTASNIVNPFKIPVIPLNAIDVEISENESVESSAESDTNTFQKVKRGRSKSKKLKLDSSSTIMPKTK